MNTSAAVIVADFSFESNIWNIEGHELHVYAVSAFHPYIQLGLERDSYSQILDAELYGTIRYYKPPAMLVTPTDPVLIVLDYGTFFEFYEMRHEFYVMFKDYFVGNETPKKYDWSKEGF